MLHCHETKKISDTNRNRITHQTTSGWEGNWRIADLLGTEPSTPNPRLSQLLATQTNSGKPSLTKQLQTRTESRLVVGEVITCIGRRLSVPMVFHMLVFYSTPGSLANWVIAGRASYPRSTVRLHLGPHKRLSHPTGRSGVEARGLVKIKNTQLNPRSSTVRVLVHCNASTHLVMRPQQNRSIERHLRLLVVNTSCRACRTPNYC
ncbi:hypothetical protein F4801DRAFT_298605 [Xylaria longipes]|nr:hypothetical protein F4801DRAFT_298605 [Xylaria longipes]